MRLFMTLTLWYDVMRIQNMQRLKSNYLFAIFLNSTRCLLYFTYWLLQQQIIVWSISISNARLCSNSQNVFIYEHQHQVFWLSASLAQMIWHWLIWVCLFLIYLTDMLFRTPDARDSYPSACSFNTWFRLMKLTKLHNDSARSSVWASSPWPLRLPNKHKTLIWL